MSNISLLPPYQHRANLPVKVHYDSSLIRRVEQLCIGIIRDIFNFLHKFFYESTELPNLDKLEVEIGLKEPEEPTISLLASPIIYGVSDLLEVNNKIDSKERSFLINFSQTFVALHSVFNKKDKSFSDFKSIAKTTGLVAFSLLSSNARLYKEFKIFNAGMALLETSINIKNTFDWMKISWNYNRAKNDLPKALSHSLIIIANLGVSFFRTYEAFNNPYFINDTEITPPLSMEERLKNICQNNFLDREAICMNEFLKIRKEANRCAKTGEQIKYYTDGKTRLFVDDKNPNAFSLEEIISFTNDKLYAMKDYFSSDTLAKLKQN